MGGAGVDGKRRYYGGVEDRYLSEICGSPYPRFPIIWVTHRPNLKGTQLRKICGKKFLETTKYEIRKL